MGVRGKIPESYLRILAGSCIVLAHDILPRWRKEMDMEMKRNLAVWAEQSWYKTHAFGPGVPALAVIDWLDEADFLTDRTAKKDASSKKECAACGWDKAGICFGPKLCRSAVDRDEWKPKDAEPKPLFPWGIEKRSQWEARRLDDLKRTIAHAAADGQDIPREWTDEFNELLRRARG